MFDIVFSSILLRLFHTTPSVLFIILQRGPLSFTSPLYLLLQITPSPLPSSCYHSRRHHSFPNAHPPPGPHPSRLFTSCSTFSCISHLCVFPSHIHSTFFTSSFPSCLSVLLLLHPFFTCLLHCSSLQFFPSPLFFLTPTSSPLQLALSFFNRATHPPVPSLLASQGD